MYSWYARTSFKVLASWVRAAPITIPTGLTNNCKTTRLLSVRELLFEADDNKGDHIEAQIRTWKETSDIAKFVEFILSLSSNGTTEDQLLEYLKSNFHFPEEIQQRLNKILTKILWQGPPSHFGRIRLLLSERASGFFLVGLVSSVSRATGRGETKEGGKGNTRGQIDTKQPQQEEKPKEEEEEQALEG